MKLKELHIRNIASIEKADIDFENGLNDAITGDPASIFLISGDTGAGKSVILDGISMALYKKTPRIADVANVKQNEFTDAKGESVRVASIEQYTRLGISVKDECYSEVVFEGNDGKTYHARLELGITNSRTKDEKGKYITKFSSPTWRYKIEDSDWTSSDIEKTLLQAIGLDFQQFGRMAMLAQGQFANFLTGDKKEREAILEQLTNTQHFTAYGEAIKSLWAQAKNTQATIQTKYDTEKPHTLTDEEVEQLTKVQETYLEQEKELNNKIEVFDNQLEQIVTVLNNKQAQHEALKKKQELEAIIAGEEYQRNKALFTDWDATTTQRQLLSNLLSARDGKKMAQDKLLKLNPNDTVKKVQDLQKQIDDLSKKRLELNPQAVNEELKKQNARKKDLSDLLTAINNLKPTIDENLELQANLKTDEGLLESIRESSKKAEVDYNSKKEIADRASQRLTTMKMSLDEKIKELRHRLYDNHTENCPLCGQHIEHICLDDDFKGMLTPLEEELQLAKNNLKNAEELRNQKMGDFNKLNGKHEGDLRRFKDNQKKIEQTQKTINNNATSLGLDIQKDLSQQISEVIESLQTSIAQLEDSQRKAEHLLEKINALSNEKQPLDALLSRINILKEKVNEHNRTIQETQDTLNTYYQDSGKTEESLIALVAQESQVAAARNLVNNTDALLTSRIEAINDAQNRIDAAFKALNIDAHSELPNKQELEEKKKNTKGLRDEILGKLGEIKKRLDDNKENNDRLKEIETELEKAKQRFARWDRLNSIFGGTRFRTLVQTYILRPLLNNANIYLEKITDRYRLTCSEANEQLSILVLDRYNKDQVRSVTVLSGGERFMISLALSLALSSLNRPDMNVNILFIDEGFGTLDEKSLDSVMSTLEKLQEIAGQTNRRVGIISHREELYERIPVQIHVVKKGEGRSAVEIKNGL